MESGKWSFARVLCGAVVSHASWISERFADQQAVHQHGPKSGNPS
jgi:hypothetical protein